MDKSKNIKHLLKGCIAKEPKAQKGLVNLYAGFIYTICHRYMRDEVFAEDMLQESLVKIFQNLERFDESKGSFESWISTIAIRQCLSVIKKKRPTLITMDVLPESQQTSDTTSSLLLDQLDTDILVQFIVDLPEGYRTVFNLSAVDGHSHAEIAELLDITIVASRSRLNRAKNILKNRVLTLNKNESWANSI